MNRSISSAVCAALALAILAGCSGADSKVVGTWKFKDIVLPASATSGPGAAFAKAMMENLKPALAGVSAEFKSDKTVTLGDASKPDQALVADWKLDGNNLTMTPKTIGGKTPDELKNSMTAKGGNSAATASAFNKAINGTLSEDGKTLTIEDTSGKGGSLILARAGS